MFQKIASGFLILINSILFVSCVSDDINKVDCDTTDLAITIQSNTPVTTCAATDGTISVAATGGKEPYTFSKDDVNFSSSTIFTSLPAGNYTLTVKDANNCTNTTTTTVTILSSTLNAEPQNISQDTECASDNGSFSIVATGGASNYQYKLVGGSFGAANSFTGLKGGEYSVTVKDGENCEFIVKVDVPPVVSYQTHIKPILQANCIKSGCHNGDNGTDRNWSVFANVKAKAAGIKTRTGNKEMPKDKAPNGLPQNEIDLIACWVDDGALAN